MKVTSYFLPVPKTTNPGWGKTKKPPQGWSGFFIKTLFALRNEGELVLNHHFTGCKRIAKVEARKIHPVRKI